MLNDEMPATAHSMQRWRARLALAALLLALAGCASDPGANYPWPYPDQPGDPGSSEEERRYPQPDYSGGGRQPSPVPDPVPGTPSPWPEPDLEPPMRSGSPRDAREASGQAVVALLDQADEATENGDYSRSAASIERALRIEPRNPYLWQALADIRLEQGQAGQAETLAKKSLGLAQGNPYAEYGAWVRMMHAREMLGDLDGAAQAREQVRGLRRYVD